jgi:hypothetical protein
VLTGLTELADLMEGLVMAPYARAEFEHDPRPKLHLKANFFASREAWSLMSREEWSDASYNYMMVRVTQVQERTAAVASFVEFPTRWPTWAAVWCRTGTAVSIPQLASA